MKSNVLILKAVLLLLGGNLVACDDSKEPEVVGTPPVAASEEVTAFFTTHLPESSYNSRMGGASPTVITTFYVWGLYSKLPGSAIDVKITII